MADFNRVILIGRLTSDPEVHTFSDGGKMSTFRFAVNNRRKNKSTGEWEKNPVFIDCKANNRESGRKLADTVENYLCKGTQVCLEGHLVLDEWVSKDDRKKNQKIRVMVDEIVFLEGKKEDKLVPLVKTSVEEENETVDIPF